MIDLESLTKISRQLDVSMGSMMGLVDSCGVDVYDLIYLLSKIIIEKNAQSFLWSRFSATATGRSAGCISYRHRSWWYCFCCTGLPVEYWAMVYLFRAVMLEASVDELRFISSQRSMLRCSFLESERMRVVAVECRRIYRVPMDEALRM